MGFRFRRSIKVGPGVRLNVGKKSMGLSVGTRGLRYSVSTSGRRATTVGIPGTGLSHVQTSSGSRTSTRSRAAGTRSTPAARRQPPPGAAQAALPKPGLFAPEAEKRFYDGVQAYLKQDFPRALQAFEAASAKDTRNVSDDLFAGLVASTLEDVPKAITYLERVVQSPIELPDQLMQKYLPVGRVKLALTVAITPRVSASVGFSSLDAALLLAELYQQTDRVEEAIGLLQQLSGEVPDDVALKLSLCDLLYEDGDDEAVVAAAVGVANDSDVGLACLHLKAKALVRQGLTDAALETFSACLKRTAGRDAELLKEIRYDRAALCQANGQATRARRDWEKLYAEDPKYRDVAKRVVPD